MQGWAPPELYAIAVRDHPLHISEEIERLLSAARYVLREKLPANTAAKTAKL